LSNRQDYFKIVGSGIEYFEGFKNYLSTNSVQGTKITHIEDVITYKNRPSRANMQPKKGRLAFARMRNTVKVLLINENLEKDYILSTGFVLLESKIEPKFVYQYLISDFFNKQKDILAEGTTQEAISNDDLNRIFIIFPENKLEQRKIAEILETVDNAIEKTEKIIEKYKRIKQGLMQDLLTKGIDEKGNIRSEKTHKFKHSPLGRIPEEWEVVTINSIIKNSLISGIWGEEPKDFENTYPILRSTEISHEGRIVIKNVAFRKVNLGPSKISKYVLRNGDILIVSSSGSEELIGRVAIFKYPGNEKFLFSNFLLRLRVGEKIDSTYMFYLLSSFWYRYFLSQFQETSTGLRNFPKNEFLNYFFFPLPPLPEQKRIAEILSQIDQAIEKEEKYKEKLERLKKGLMEDLLTGKVRVNKLLEGENHEMA
jgi:type I restriction enzyme S subunit